MFQQIPRAALNQHHHIHLFWCCKQTSRFLVRVSWPSMRCECVSAYARIGRENVKVDHHWAVFLNLCSCVLAFACPQDGRRGAGIGRFRGKVSSAGTWHPPLPRVIFTPRFERIFLKRPWSESYGYINHTAKGSGFRILFMSMLHVVIARRWWWTKTSLPTSSIFLVYMKRFCDNPS